MVFLNARLCKTAASEAAASAATGTHRFHTQLGASPSFGYLLAGATAGDVYLGPTIERSGVSRSTSP